LKIVAQTIIYRELGSYLPGVLRIKSERMAAQVASALGIRLVRLTLPIRKL
jgi:hypothetical protein